jgi:hypothetical protein
MRCPSSTMIALKNNTKNCTKTINKPNVNELYWKEHTKQRTR